MSHLFTRQTALGVGRGPCLTRGLLTNSSFSFNPQFSCIRISICMWRELPGGSARPNHHSVSQMFCVFASRSLSLRKSEATSFPPACLPSARVQKAPVMYCSLLFTFHPTRRDSSSGMHPFQPENGLFTTEQIIHFSLLTFI